MTPFLILFGTVVLIFVLGMITYYKLSYGNVLSIPWREHILLGIKFGLFAVVLAFIMSDHGYLQMRFHPEKFEYRTVYGEAMYLNDTTSIEFICGLHDSFYIFSCINKSDNVIWRTVDETDIDIIRICGVKPCYIPVVDYVCLNPPFMTKVFMGKRKIKHTHRLNDDKDKLILEEDTKIRKYKYVKIENE